MDFLNGKRIILASASPRRKELLAGLDIPFEVIVHKVEENFPPSLKNKEIPGFLAKLKAKPFKKALNKNELVITSDTVVVLDKELMEKPKSKDEAVSMLTKLSGKKHKVYTAICVTSFEKQICITDKSTVYFKELDNDEIEYYVEKYKPYDKAGSYGIQEWLGHFGIEKIKGSYNNIMGLPTHRLYDILKNF